MRIPSLLILSLSIAATGSSWASDQDPVSVLNKYEEMVKIGQSDRSALEETLAKSGCGLADVNAYQYRLVKEDKKEACYGASEGLVSFLGPKGTVDNLTVVWKFKNRDEMVKLNDTFEKAFKEKYGIGKPAASGNFFIHGSVFQNDKLLVNLLWDTYGEWSKVELTDANANKHHETLAESIRLLADKFPGGKGETKNLGKAAEEFGCFVTPLGHESWLTLRNKVARECRGMNIYFKLDKDKEKITEIKFTPAVPDNGNYDRVKVALTKLYGQPQTKTLQLFNQEALVFSSPSSVFTVTKVKNRGKDNADVVMSAP